MKKNKEVPWNLLDVSKAVAVLLILVVWNTFSKISLTVKNPPLTLKPLVVAISMTLVYGILLFWVWFFTVRKYKVSWESLGFASFDLRDGIIMGITWLVAIKFLIFLYALLAGKLGLEPSPEMVEQIPRLFGSSLAGMMLATFTAAFIAPFVEEIFFRGFLYSALRKKVGVGWAIILSAVIFGFMHANAWTVIPVIIIGVVLAYLYEREKSLGPPIILHALNNLTSIILVYYFYK